MQETDVEDRLENMVGDLRKFVQNGDPDGCVARRIGKDLLILSAGVLRLAFPHSNQEGKDPVLISACRKVKISFHIPLLAEALLRASCRWCPFCT